MRAASYVRQGPASEVLEVGELDDPVPGPGEVRVAVRASGVNPGDVKKRAGWLGSSMAFGRIVPHSDGAGVVESVGEGVDPGRVGSAVWVLNAQSYRPWGTAAELVVVPEAKAIALPEVDDAFVAGACLGIPGVTAHRALFADGPPAGATVLVHGAAGAVGAMACGLASWASARVIGTVRSSADVARARAAGAAEVVVTGPEAAGVIRALAPGGVDRIVEVALGANAALDADVLSLGGVIAAYASDVDEPSLPFWPLLFQNVTLQLVGSDDVPEDAKTQAARDVSAALATGALSLGPIQRFGLDEIAAAHDAAVAPGRRGRVVLEL